MTSYETPILITYGWDCPYHRFHHRQVMLAAQPRANKIIDQNVCASQFPGEPIYRTRLYGNLKLEVNQTINGEA
jgi:hypothetical protein